MTDHLIEYELVKNINRKFRKGDIVLGTKFGAYTWDLLLYDKSMSNKTYAMFDYVKVKEAANEKNK